MASDAERQPQKNAEWSEQVDHVLQSALKRRPEERSAFLQEVCAGDAALLREVQSLLSAQLLVNDFLENPPLEAALHLIGKRDDLEGVEIGPYAVQFLLGSGGMGEVYKATDTRLNRAVAIKFLSAAESLETRLQYFEREARLASSLNHPNIVTIYEFGRSEVGPYMAMEWVDGKTLRHLLAEAPLPLDRVLQLASQIADGLSKAHSAGIFHRDLKPENLMVTAEGLVKILDFGIAKLTSPVSGLEQGEGAPSLFSKPGVILGTVGYMSPEQASGLPADFRSDQFSLGAILYEMVTGRRAFERASPVETLSAIIRDEPEPIASLNPKTPASLRLLIERCLAKNPEDRYAATSDLATDLKELRDHLEEISAREAVQATRDRSMASKRRVLYWAGLGTLFLAALLLILGDPAVPLSIKSDAITYGNGHVSEARFTADDQKLIYAANWAGEGQQLYITEPGDPAPISLGINAVGIWGTSSKGDMAIPYPCRLNWGVCYGPLAVVAKDTTVPREILPNVTAADWSADGESLIAAQVISETRYRIVRFPLRVDGRMGTKADIKVLLNDQKGWVTDVRVLPNNRIAFIEHLRGEISGYVCVLDSGGKKRILLGKWKTVLGLDWHPLAEEIWFTGSEKGRSVTLQLFAVNLRGDLRPVDSLPNGGVLADISEDGRVLIRKDVPHGWIT